MSKRILLLALGAVLLFGNARVFGDSIKIQHNQMTLVTEPLGTLDRKGNQNPSVTITVTNMTGMPWSNYEIFFTGTNVKVGNILENSLSGFSKWDCKKKNTDCTELQLYDGSVGNLASLTITLNVGYTNLVTITGKPTTGNVVLISPEPSSQLLMGTALVGLVPVIRRKLRM